MEAKELAEELLIALCTNSGVDLLCFIETYGNTIAAALERAAEAKTENATLRDLLIVMCELGDSSAERMTHRITELEAQLAAAQERVGELEADAERLDKLDALLRVAQLDIRRNGVGDVAIARSYSDTPRIEDYGTLRHAIDAFSEEP